MRTASFTFVTKTPPARYFIKKAAEAAEGREDDRAASCVGKVTHGTSCARSPKRRWRISTPTTSTRPCRMIAGSARSMGLEVVE